MKTLILAAGYGTRLLPYTRQLPKPLFPVANKPLIEYTIETMLPVTASKEFIVNLHHLPEMIPVQLKDGARLGAKISYSPEREILGTGGAMLNLQDKLSSSDFWVVNADMLFNLNLKDALTFHKQNNALATLILFKTPAAKRYGHTSINRAGQIMEFVPKNDGRIPDEGLIFTGIHIINPAIFKYFPTDTKVFCIVAAVYKKILTTGRIFGFECEGTWQDIGNPDEYMQANMRMLEKEKNNTLIDNSASVENGATVGPFTVIGKNARIGANANVKNSVVWPGAHIKAGAQVSGQIITV
ncbi:NDP-sugar synthase [Oscillibacter sp.]|uniref:nucleotidyltransferase family protein n=1 Tax=Oscillibacter sp. TaxID=1945593 RepID=UPI002639B22B|nr:NDP-sugar synthase [Oscillibacter sp.]MDD3347629.1 NDP-sugar synthase [Oscillibacter sp.]